MGNNISTGFFRSRILLWLFCFLAITIHAQAKEVCLLNDPDFKKGVKIYDPIEGKGHKQIGKLTGADNSTPPVWGLSQWNTSSPFSGTPAPAQKNSNFIKYKSGSKEIIFGEGGTNYADVTLKLNSIMEYRQSERQPGVRWPALYLWQKIKEGPSLAQLTKVRFVMDARLLSSNNLHPQESYDRKREAAQFTVFLTLQNMNKSSSDFGKYIWFGIPVYDNRNEFPPSHEQKDKFTNKFISMMDVRLLKGASLTSGAWVHFEGNLIDEMRNSFQHAIGKNFFPDSTFTDMYVRSINIGWEIPGTFESEMQFRNLDVCIEQ